MSNEKLHLLRHSVKGTLQQVDAIFDLIERADKSDPQESQELRDEMAKALERIARELKTL